MSEMITKYVFALDRQDGTGVVCIANSMDEMQTKRTFHKGIFIGNYLNKVGSRDMIYNEVYRKIGLQIYGNEYFSLKGGIRSELAILFSNRRNNRQGYVYIIARSNGDFKIGLTKNIETRLRQLSKQYEGIVLIHTIPCDDRYMGEKYIHEMFASVRKEGEWFALTRAMLDEIVNYTHFEEKFFYTRETLTHYYQPNVIPHYPTI